MLENGIGLSASEISILGEPIEFYEQLISNIENAKNNIILSSLYIGNGDKETRLYNAIEDFLSRGGKALIILDFNRGQRGKISSKTILQSIQSKYPESLTLKVSFSGVFFGNQQKIQFFKSELMDQSKIASKIPQLKETVSTQHTKIYICDEKLIFSGANLESAYFTNRQGTMSKIVLHVGTILNDSSYTSSRRF